VTRVPNCHQYTCNSFGHKTLQVDTRSLEMFCKYDLLPSIDLASSLKANNSIKNIDNCLYTTSLNLDTYNCTIERAAAIGDPSPSTAMTHRHGKHTHRSWKCQPRPPHLRSSQFVPSKSPPSLHLPANSDACLKIHQASMSPRNPPRSKSPPTRLHHPWNCATEWTAPHHLGGPLLPHVDIGLRGAVFCVVQ
jgi:hypothetical protein